jgi:deazaflavin-dependent oxidoreductase (nitroreductase family)
MDWAGIQEFAAKKVLYLTTIGRRTGLPRQIEIWFVVYRGRFYLFAETGEAAAWVKNIRRNPEVGVRIGERQIGATARVLNHETDRALWEPGRCNRRSQIWMGGRAAGGNHPLSPTRGPFRPHYQASRGSLS